MTSSHCACAHDVGGGGAAALFVDGQRRGWTGAERGWGSRWCGAARGEVGGGCGCQEGTWGAVGRRETSFDSLNFHTGSFGDLATAMVDDIFAKVLAKVSPTTTDTDHHSLPFFTNGTNKELGGGGLAAVVKVVELDTAVFSLVGM